METEDILLAAIPIEGQEDSVDLLLIDPMPGGSGLLQQMIEFWPEVVDAAIDVAVSCPSQCEISCPDCLQSYRNQQYHAFLDRHMAETTLKLWGRSLVTANIIPAKVAARQTSGDNTNNGEQRLTELLNRAGLQPDELQHQVDLPTISTHTTPDVYFECSTDAFEGVCVYIDGMSRGLHGNPVQAAQDQLLRSTLENMGYKVIVIPASELNDSGAMVNHFVSIARAVSGKSRANQVKESADQWWTD